MIVDYNTIHFSFYVSTDPVSDMGDPFSIFIL